MFSKLKKFFIGSKKDQPIAPEIKNNVEEKQELQKDTSTSKENKYGMKGCFGGPGRAGIKLSRRIMRKKEQGWKPSKQFLKLLSSV